MSASLDKTRIEEVNDQQNSLLIIKETVEDMGGTCKINWQTGLVKIDGPLPDLTYAIAIEAALAKIGARELYNLGENNNVFIEEADSTKKKETSH